ncbi:coiled-coil domain-containing protein 103 [Colias croceus]|uniref:coiled-coil domain-containing protein 103 n=1 Tax=Colias crocea TaxID=72248 RepID=UPI001E27D7B9|nr:coiled-coil domain-containing protein 103 [Colias croceus]
MDKPLNKEDIAAMESQLRQSMDEDRKYWRVNDVKCDAIHTAKSYEEFADRVAAAHLRPLDKNDFKNKSTRGWNQFSTNKKDDEE